MARKTEPLDAGALLLGTLIGMVAGSIAALFLTPRSGAENRRQITSTGHGIRQQLEEAVTPTDPLEESIAEGKAAARRRRLELGLD